MVATQTFFIFTPIPGEMIQFDDIIFFKWVVKNHQLVFLCFVCERGRFEGLMSFLFVCLFVCLFVGTPVFSWSIVFSTDDCFFPRE